MTTPVTVVVRLGHVLDHLRAMPAESVHCVITSPPYWGLRSYKTEPQIWGGILDCDLVHPVRIVEVRHASADV